jgi:hypothetical protein
VDQDRLVDIVRRVSELAADGRDRIAEIDVNPLICAGSRQVAWTRSSFAGRLREENDLPDDAARQQRVQRRAASPSP